MVLLKQLHKRHDLLPDWNSVNCPPSYRTWLIKLKLYITNSKF